MGLISGTCLVTHKLRQFTWLFFVLISFLDDLFYNATYRVYYSFFVFTHSCCISVVFLYLLVCVLKLYCISKCNVAIGQFIFSQFSCIGSVCFLGHRTNQCKYEPVCRMMFMISWPDNTWPYNTSTDQKRDFLFSKTSLDQPLTLGKYEMYPINESGV